MADAVPENRVIAHFDIDCFYAQSEELRCPSLQGRPVGVTQKFLVVTTNYVARGLGVPKMVSIDEAKRKLPELVLVNGEDLTPYRADSKRIMTVLRRFGPVERHGLDEGAVDITALVAARLWSGPTSPSFTGHVLGMEPVIRTDAEQRSTLIDFKSVKLNFEDFSHGDVSLLVGTQVVDEMRTAIKKETGFHCSCGVAENKMLAKLASSLNKPKMQTCLLSGAVTEFLAPLSVRKIPGVGKQMQAALTDLGVEKISDLREVPMKQLSKRLGDRMAFFLFNACRGRDPTPVQDKGPPKSISVEDSFRNCRTIQHAEEILRVLAIDLIRRLDEDREETGRRPKSFTVKWRVHGTKWNFVSLSTEMPLELLLPTVAIEKRAFLAVEVAIKLLVRGLGQSFHIVVLNIGATNFISESSSSSSAVRDIRTFLQGQGKVPGKELKVISKRDARARRETFKAMAPHAPIAETEAPSCTPKLQAKYSPEIARGNLRPIERHMLGDYHLSYSSEDEEVDLAERLRLPGGQSPAKQIGARTIFSRGRMSSLQDQYQAQHANLTNLTQVSPSHTGISSEVFGLPQSQGIEFSKLRKTSHFNEARRADPVIANPLMGQSCSTVQSVNDQPFSRLEAGNSLLGTAGLLSGALPHSVGMPILEIQDSSRPSRAGIQSIVTKSTSPLFNIHDDTLNSLMSRGDAMETGVLSEPNASSMARAGCSGGEDGSLQPLMWTTCGQCGALVEESELGKQEHADYHFAMTLHLGEGHALLPQRAVPSGASLTPKEDGLVSPFKRSRTRDGTLDKFVLRHK